MNFLFVAIALLFYSVAHGQTVVLNELMSSNHKTIQDKDGDYSDWIELYNPTDEAVHLSGYSLSDKKSKLDKWTFPDITIPSKGYLLVFASGKDIKNPKELHLNFKISSDGEDLFLTNDFGEIIDQVGKIDLDADESYCRIPDGGLKWISSKVPSPGASNNFSNQLIFSEQEGFYRDSFYLFIESLNGDTVFYTMDGNIPNSQSEVFDGYLTIKDRTDHPNVFSEIPTTPVQDIITYKAWESPQTLIDKATVLRCVTYRNGVRTSQVYTKTYFVDNKNNLRYTTPVLSLITESDNLFDYGKGLFVPGKYFSYVSPEWTGNYFKHGKEWERDVYIEYFNSKGEKEFSQDAGLRIHGGKTRHAAQKSLTLYARAKYGVKNFKYELLPNRSNDKYKRFILQTTMGALFGSSIIKDVYGQNIVSSFDIDYQEFQPVTVFINGEYWGVYSIRDKIDNRYIQYTHGIDKDNVEFVEDDSTSYNQLMQYISENSLESNANYEYVKKKIDINNYIDYTIAEQFLNNYDWPGNNMKIWRSKENGKWRWVLYDLDYGFGDAGYDMFTHSIKNDPSITWPNPPSSTFLFRNLLKNQSFKTKCIKRYEELLNSDFAVKIMKSKLDSIKSLYQPEIPKHIERWNYPKSMDSWEYHINNDLLSFIEKRPCEVSRQIKLFFGLKDFGFDCLSNVNELANRNQLILAPNPNSGSFFIYNSITDMKDANIFVTDMSGRIVYNASREVLLRNVKLSFDLSNLPNGVYVLHLVSKGYSEQKRFVKFN
ncbi:MAG: CotH kinase family protein [Chitinophagales bacterium]|nr:CotH kinase family protein [Chitinophagales bacterium]